MIAQCNGTNCPIKGTCYRWLMPDAKVVNARIQSMFSPVHKNCRNYWAATSKEKRTSLDRHAQMLDAMIDRIIDFK